MGRQLRGTPERQRRRGRVKMIPPMTRDAVHGHFQRAKAKELWNCAYVLPFRRIHVYEEKGGEEGVYGKYIGYIPPRYSSNSNQNLFQPLLDFFFFFFPISLHSFNHPPLLSFPNKPKKATKTSHLQKNEINKTKDHPTTPSSIPHNKARPPFTPPSPFQPLYQR